jgi:hypothetical protein
LDYNAVPDTLTVVPSILEAWHYWNGRDWKRFGF